MFARMAITKCSTGWPKNNRNFQLTILEPTVWNQGFQGCVPSVWWVFLWHALLSGGLCVTFSATHFASAGLQSVFCHTIPVSTYPSIFLFFLLRLIYWVKGTTTTHLATFARTFFHIKMFFILLGIVASPYWVIL